MVFWRLVARTEKLESSVRLFLAHSGIVVRTLETALIAIATSA